MGSHVRRKTSDSTTQVQYENTDLLAYVAHGSDATVARPTGAGAVVWIGTVSPNNATASDLWVDTS